MACKDCIHFNVCRPYVSPDECFPEVEGGCTAFKDKRLYRHIPCSVGDEVYVIRKYGDEQKIRRGKVSEMYFVEQMRLCIVVKDIARGEWGKKVFPTYEEAEKYLKGGASRAD